MIFDKLVKGEELPENYEQQEIDQSIDPQDEEEAQIDKSSFFNIKTLKLATLFHKRAQATLDALGPFSEDNWMSAFNWHNIPSDILEQMDPADNQRQGISNDVQLPAKNDDIKKRIKEFADFFKK